MYKLLLFILFVLFLLIGIPILFEYWKNKTMKYIYNSGNKHKRQMKKMNLNGDLINPLYLNARDLFKSGMKNKALKREDILELTDLLERSIGSYVRVYNGFKFDNDAHRIYVYLKSKEISIVDMQRIVKFLERKLA